MESNLFAMMQREWRQTGGHQTGVLNSGQVIHDSAPSPTVSASRKKQKITSSVPAQSFGGPSPSFHPQPVAAPHQPSSVGKRGSVPGHKGKKQKPGQVLPGASSIKQYPSSGPGGRNQVPNRVTSGTVAGELAEGTSFDSLNGRRLRTRWPDDNNFYEAVITDYNPVERRHHLVYDMGSTNETWEWVNLSEDSTFEFERKRNRPERYDRNLADSVLKAIPKIDKIRVSREERHHKNRCQSVNGEKRKESSRNVFDNASNLLTSSLSGANLGSMPIAEGAVTDLFDRPLFFSLYDWFLEHGSVLCINWRLDRKRLLLYQIPLLQDIFCEKMHFLKTSYPLSPANAEFRLTLNG